MLYNEEEEKIMSSAIQDNMRLKKTAVPPFERIVTDFLGNSQWEGKRILDIGPGQCDFLDIARSKGAKTFGLDFDPAVHALGVVRGHSITIGDVKDGWPYGPATFDGIFCRGSINIFSLGDRLEAFLGGLASSLVPGGWIWIAPWNHPGKSSAERAALILQAKDRWIQDSEITVYKPDLAAQERYSIVYAVPELELWLKGLSIPSQSGSALT